MCLAVPARVISIDGSRVRVEMAGVTREASAMMVPGVCLGDYVLIHAGFAIEKLDPVEAERTLELFGEIAKSVEQESTREVSQ